MLRYFWNWLLSFFSSWRNSREVKQEEANLDTKIEEAKVVRDKLIEQQAEREVAIKEVSGASGKGESGCRNRRSRSSQTSRS
jgi:hypothetical protein